MASRLPRWFFAFFLVSGFCSLVYEVVWLRLAMALFGVTAAMVASVLSVFMAGLAVGSWVGGVLAPRLAERSTARALRAYAVAELGIAAGGVIVPVLLRTGRALLTGAGGALSWGSLSFHLASGAWVALVLLPFCACMGATFPLALAALRRDGAQESGRSFSYLYVANVIGATAGTLTSAFALIELLGFRRTLHLTAALNAALAVSVIGLAVGRVSAPHVEQTPEAPKPAAGSRRLLPVLFATGLVSMGLEVVWVRLTTPHLGNVVYTFATVLSLYLAATFLGSLAYRWRARRAGAAWGWRMALASMVPLALVPLLTLDPRVVALLQGPVAARLLLALGIVPFCALVGYVTPMLVDRRSGGEPRAAGAAYAVNVLGCIAGPLLAGFVLLPVLGERWTLGTLAVPLLLLAARGGEGPGPRRWGWLAGGAAAAAMLAFTRDFESRFNPRHVLRDGTATVVAHGAERGKSLLVNGSGMTSLTPITKMMAHLPLGLLPRPPRHGLVICFGMGTSLRSMHAWGIKATAVELVPSVPELFWFFHADAPEVLRSPEVRVVIDDGRRFLERTTDTYDVVVIDPPPPLEAAGSSLLYSLEFYDAVRERLAPDGIVQQWIPEATGGDSAIRTSFVLALREAFPFVRAYGSVAGWGVHLLASPRPLQVPAVADLVARLPPTAVADLLEWGPYSGAKRQFAAVLDSEMPLDSIVAEAPRVGALRDDRPINEYFLLRRALGRRF